MAASAKRARRLKLLLAWLCTALLIGVYFSLPDADDAPGAELPARSALAQPIPARIEVLSVTPSDATAGSAVTVQFTGAVHPDRVQAYVSKTSLKVLSRLDDALVVRLPSDAAPGH